MNMTNLYDDVEPNEELLCYGGRQSDFFLDVRSDAEQVPKGGIMRTKDDPVAFLIYMLNQYKKMWFSTKDIVHWGEKIEDMTLQDFRTALLAVKMIQEHEGEE